MHATPKQWRAQDLKFGYSKIYKQSKMTVLYLLLPYIHLVIQFNYYRLAKIMGIQRIPLHTKCARPWLYLWIACSSLYFMQCRQSQMLRFLVS